MLLRSSRRQTHLPRGVVVMMACISRAELPRPRQHLRKRHTPVALLPAPLQGTRKRGPCTPFSTATRPPEHVFRIRGESCVDDQAL